jgi:peptide deformylase
MKQLLKIARMGHPVLRQVAVAVDRKRLKEREYQDFIDSMIATMLEYDGVGLAAPQVHVSERVVVFHEEAGLVDGGGQPITVLVNPVIRPLTEQRSAMWEGCLSVPYLRGKVSRPNKVSVEALDRRGRAVELTLSGFAAIVNQHECDHLDGILYIDRLDDTRQLAFIEEYARYAAPKAEQEGTYAEE